jgi:uncharacterized cofD-like protein
VIPNLLVDGVRESIRWSSGATVYVCNVATQEGETDHFDYEAHVHQIVEYLGEGELDYALLNNNRAALSAIRPHEHVEAIVYDGAALTRDGVEIIARDVVNDQNPLRHDPLKLASELLEIGRRHRAAPVAPPLVSDVQPAPQAESATVLR